MNWKTLVLTAALLLAPGDALAQLTESSTQPQEMEENLDSPIGSPYRIDQSAQFNSGSQVSVRDFLSSRIDNLRSEILGLLNERDRLVMQRFDLTDKNVVQAFTAANAAVQKAEDAQGLRNVVSNEWRGALDDQAKTLASRDWVESKVAGVSDQLDRIVEQQNVLDSRMVVIGGTLTALQNQADGNTNRGDRLLTQMSLLETRITEINSVAAGANRFWTIAVSIIVAGGVVFGAIMAFRRVAPPRVM